jgi:hypothetical protein
MEDETVVSQQAKETIYLRTYSKVIFFYPLLFTSLVLWIFETIIDTPVAWFGLIWMIVFFMNLFVIAFDVSSSHFVILILILAIVSIVLVVIVAQNPTSFSTNLKSDILMSSEFYLWITIILSIIFIFALLKPLINYWKIESNELFHKQGLFHAEERYPTRYLRFKKAIPDVFEYLLLRAGEITLMVGRKDVFHLPTILNVSKKARRMEKILSILDVDMDNLDGQ